MAPSLILGITFAYFLLVYVISYITGRHADSKGFFIGNRKNPWFVVAIAMVGSGISGVTFVSVPGMVKLSGFAYLQMILGFLVGQILIAYILLPLFYRLKLISVYEYLKDRFGQASYKTGAWFFFVSKMLGAAVRLFLVSLTLQLLVFGPLELSFFFNVVITMAMVWLYTSIGGVKSLIWTDMLKTFCLVFSVVLTIYFISKGLKLDFGGLVSLVKDSHMSKIFFFENVNERQYFWKYFIAGVFTVIAMNGLDQDMMQRNLSCKNHRESRKNMLVSILLQFLVISLFLILGVMLYSYANAKGIVLPDRGDEVFPFLATGNYFPKFVGILFIIGLISASFQAAGSALTALTTSYTIDILQRDREKEDELTRCRKTVHLLMTVVMGLCIYGFYLFSNTSVIDAVYILASYTYGPILGLFAFGIILKAAVRDKLIPIVALASPVCCFILDLNSERWFGGYKFSYEILILNAFLTFLGLCFLIQKPKHLHSQAE